MQILDLIQVQSEEIDMLILLVPPEKAPPEDGERIQSPKRRVLK
jgi:hypothetical protein